MCACALGGDRATIPDVIPLSPILFPFKALILLFSLMYLCEQILCVLCVLWVAWEARIGAGPLELEFQAAVSHSTRVLGSQVRSSEGIVYLLQLLTLLFEAKTLTAWSSPRRKGWPASDPQGSLCLLASSKIRKHHRTCCCYGCQFFPLFQTLFNRIHCAHPIFETLKLTRIALAPYTQTPGASLCVWCLWEILRLRQSFWSGDIALSVPSCLCWERIPLE